MEYPQGGAGGEDSGLWGGDEEETLLRQALSASKEVVVEDDQHEDDAYGDVAYEDNGLITDWHVGRVRKLMGRITATVQSVPTVWLLYAAVHAAQGNKDKELDCRLRQCRTLQKSGWHKELEKIEDVAEAVVALVLLYTRMGGAQNLRAASIYLKGAIKRVEADWSTSQPYALMAGALATLEVDLPAAVAAEAVPEEA